MRQDSVVLRPARADDEAFVNDLLFATMHDYVEATWPNDPAAHQRYYESNKFDWSKTRILQVGGKDVGRLSTTVRSDCIFVDELHIIPDYQRRGIGEQVIQQVLHEARSNGLPVRLTVLTVNPARELYLRLGFKVIAEEDRRLYLEYKSAFGRYEIIRQLASSDMGELYLARDPFLERQVVIKALPVNRANVREAIQRFKREAWALSQLNHPGICTIYDKGEDFLAMEYIEGEHPRGPLKPSVAVPLAIKITEALEAVHTKNIVHRDLKPSNILITQSGAIKLLDFGLCVFQAPVQAVSTESTVSFVTPQGTLLGTRPYMSPEQAQALPIDARSDIFSFGSVLYEMLSGRRPFPAEPNQDVRDSIIHRDPIPLKTPPDLQAIVFRCLEKDPERRFQTASDLNKALQSAWSVAEPMLIRVCDDWYDPEVQRLMSSAQSTIDIIDSYYDESNNLANYVAKALRRTEKLHVNLYMLDPKKPFGGQRLIEKLGRAEREKIEFGALDETYRKLFEKCCDDAREKFGETRKISESGTILTIYHYPTMPCLRMFVVDRSHFIFGWFPLNETNPNYPCIIVSKFSRSEADRKLAERLGHQLDKICESAFKV